MKKDNKVMLNVASGVFVMEDYINVDNSPFLLLSTFYPVAKFFLNKTRRGQVEKFIEAKKKATIMRADCSKPLPFSDSSVDHIYCSHFLEHLYQDEAIETLNDFFRILKKNGTLHIIVPDLLVLANDYINRKNGDNSANVFIESTTLTWPKRPRFIFRLFNFIEGYGLTHLWMYDKQSLTKQVMNVGFTIVPKEEVPTPTIYSEGLHVTAKKL